MPASSSGEGRSRRIPFLTTPLGALPSRWSGAGFESSRYLGKWLLLSSAIGVVAGFGAILFYLAIELTTRLALGYIVGYHPPHPLGEAPGGETLRATAHIARPWLLPLVTALGGLISGLIVFTWAPEAEGHGTDAAIGAIHHKGGRIRPRVPPIKLLASAITIGTGGSGGREGPAAQISAGFGYILGSRLGLDVHDRRIMVAAGMGAGIGAIFRAPLGGAVMAAEILYLHDLEIEALMPALIASIVGYSVYGAFFGFSPIFGAQPELALSSPVQLLYYAALGVAAGLMGILYAQSFYGTAVIFHRLNTPRWIKPALGGLIVGLIGIVVPQSLHMGYGWVQVGMTGLLLAMPLWLVLVLPFVKILATSLSIGSGGSGGIFGPGMVIGGMLGASFWRLGHIFLPNLPSSPAPFVIVGMMATFGGIAHAPLAVMLMVAEMTGNLSLLAPAMIAVAISTALVGNNTIYRAQLPNRASSPAHRLQFSFPLLSSLLVRDAMSVPARPVRKDDPISKASGCLVDAECTGVAVLDEAGAVVGVLSRDDLLEVPRDEMDTMPVQQRADMDIVPLGPDESLDVALQQLASEGLTWSPVVEDQRLVGHLDMRDVMRTYKATLERGVRRASSLPVGTTLFEVRLSPESPLAGKALHEAGLPRGTLVVSINRGGETIFPRGDTCLEPGDAVMLMSNPADEPALRSFLEGRPPAAVG